MQMCYVFQIISCVYRHFKSVSLSVFLSVLFLVFISVIYQFYMFFYLFLVYYSMVGFCMMYICGMLGVYKQHEWGIIVYA